MIIVYRNIGDVNPVHHRYRINQGYTSYDNYSQVSGMAKYIANEIYSLQPDGTLLVMKSSYRNGEIIEKEEALLIMLQSKPWLKANWLTS